MAREDSIRVVNLPDPRPVAYHGGHIPLIPDDIIREISTFLNFDDRLALSLTSGHMHAVVRPCLEEVVVEAPQLAALHAWMFEDPSPRGLQLRALDFVAPPVIWSWFDRERYGSAVQYCLDILRQTSRLEDLSCAPFLSHALDTQHLQAFAKLQYLHLSGCTEQMLTSLQLPLTLTQLHLSDTPAGTMLPFRRILRTTVCLPALTTLVLERLSLPDGHEDGAVYISDDDDNGDEDTGEDGYAEGFEDEGVDENGDADEDAYGENEDDGDHGGMGGDHNGLNSSDALIVSSVRTLKTLEQELPPCVSLATTFPGLHFLVLDGSTHLNVDVGTMGTLQHLVVSESFTGEPVRWRVHHLTYVPGITARESLVLNRACDSTHLVSLTLQLVFVSYLMWNEVTVSAPNIRLLEIESLQTALPDYISLFSNLFKSDAPVTLPLLCLSILAPAASTSSSKEESREAFLIRAFKHLSSLRYVALAESPEGETLPCKDDYSGLGAPWRWWRVSRDKDGTPVEIREIPGWEGERVRRYLHETDEEGAGRLGENFDTLR